MLFMKWNRFACLLIATRHDISGDMRQVMTMFIPPARFVKSGTYRTQLTEELTTGW